MSAHTIFVLLGKRDPASRPEVLTSGPLDQPWTWTADRDYLDLKFFTCTEEPPAGEELPPELEGTPGAYGEPWDLRKGQVYRHPPTRITPER